MVIIDGLIIIGFLTTLASNMLIRVASVYAYRSHFVVDAELINTYITSPQSLLIGYLESTVPSVQIYITWFEWITLISNTLIPVFVALLVYRLAKYREVVRDAKQHKREKQLKEVAFLREMVIEMLKMLEDFQQDDLYVKELDGSQEIILKHETKLKKLLPSTELRLRRLDTLILHLRNEAEQYEFYTNIEIIRQAFARFEDCLQDYTKSVERTDNLFTIERALLEIRIKLGSFHV